MKFKIKWVLVVNLVCFWVFGSFSQTLNTLTVNGSSHLAGDYTLARMEWGNQSNNEITADAVFSDPALACSSLTNDVEGKIVFVDRNAGTECKPDSKALRAQQAGAIAVIICNHIAAPEPLQLLPPDTLTAQINIPVFMASQETCNILRVNLTSAYVHVTIGYKCEPPTYTTNVVWGDKPGEGDFSNGLAGWTVDKGWVYNPEGILRNGAYTGAPKVIGSLTSCNGVAEFNSDYLDNRGMTNPNGTPVSGAGDCAAVCTGYILSPNIIFTQPIGGLSIEFTQSLRQFKSHYYIMVSKDGGITFPDTVRINTEFPENSNHITKRKKFSIPGFEGVDSIRFKFEYVGNYFYWAIDDIVVYDEQIVDLQVNRDWYSVSPFYKMPKSQVSEIPFLANVSNFGNIIATDVQLNVNINGPSINENFDLMFENLPAYSTWENRPFPLAYTSPSNVGTYTAEYHISSTEEEDGPNNKAGFQWKVTNQTFGNLDTESDFGSPYMQFFGSPWSIANESKEYSIANIYYVPIGSADGYVVTKARYGLANTLNEVSGQTIRIDLFEWVDADNSRTSQPSERTRVGSNFQIIDESISNLRLIETDIWASDEDRNPIEGERVKLKENTHYLLTATVLPKDTWANPQMRLLGFTPRNLDNYSRSTGHMIATNFALDTLQSLNIIGHRISGSLFAYHNILIPLPDIDERDFRFIFNGNLYAKAFLEMDIAVTTANSQDHYLPPHSVTIFPNPASRDLFVDLNLEKASDEVQVSMFNIEGKLVSTQTFYNVMDDRLKLDVSKISKGVYNVKVVTPEGVATRKVVIQN